jgi:glucose-1-phosphate cytidylyltransferase
MKIIILAGGLGTRISEETNDKPKPMVLIGNKPILWHLMNIFSKQGRLEFIVALGYKGEVIKKWLAEDKINGSHSNLKGTGENGTPILRVETIETGLNTQTAGRIAQCMRTVPGERVLVTYGDGLGNVNIDKLIEFHNAHGKLATVTAVRPPARFGYMKINKNLVVHFGEKNQVDAGWINGGFFILEPEVLKYLEGDSEPFESKALPDLVNEGQLMAFQHFGFWQPMDTLREKQDLERMLQLSPPPWLDF